MTVAWMDTPIWCEMFSNVLIWAPSKVFQFDFMMMIEDLFWQCGSHDHALANVMHSRRGWFARKTYV